MIPVVEFVRLMYKYQRSLGVRVYSKSQKWRVLWQCVDLFLRIVSGGKNKQFLTHVTTTIGPYVFYPVGWTMGHATLSDCVVLQHEAKHVEWFKKAGLGNAWRGVPVIAVLYLLFPLPIGLAWFRYAMERVAYKVSIDAWKQYGLDVKIDYYVTALSGPDYLWAWPRKLVAAWFKQSVSLR